VIQFISIVVLTFALALIVLGAITMWLERGRGRLQGVALTLVGLLVGIGYAFLGSRFSLALFDHLIVQVDLPALMATAFTYTAGVLSGVSLAVGLFIGFLAFSAASLGERCSHYTLYSFFDSGSAGLSFRRGGDRIFVRCAVGDSLGHGSARTPTARRFG